MPVSPNALKCLPACKNHLCDNMIDKDFEESGDDTADSMKVITLVCFVFVLIVV